MKSAIVAGLVAMAFGAASSSTALAQAKKEASPGAVTSASAAKALPGSASQSGVVGQGVVVGQHAHDELAVEQIGDIGGWRESECLEFR